MSKVGTKRQVRQLSVHEKLEAIQRVHEGESKASVARVMGVPESTLRGWCKNEDKLHAMAIKTSLDNTPETTMLSTTTSSTDGGPSDSKRLKEDYQYHWNQSMLSTPLAAATTTLTTTTIQPQQQQQQQTTTNNTTLTTNTSTESWFWRWYKHYGFHNPLEPLPLVKSKSTLDTVLLNLNNNNVQEEIKENNHANTISSDEDDPPETAQEALKHGEKFLRWLECCSDPSVTAVQLLQFRYLLNNVRSCAERRANKMKTVPRSRRK
ncbi:uncharacterized protein [Rhodnius prolixus]|uniref:uncharacterized protein n=1 Tax=Rhodnius prolixus TaxID=13249 RepID=UPI003D189498